MFQKKVKWKQRIIKKYNFKGIKKKCGAEKYNNWHKNINQSSTKTDLNRK
jgi:hypothetical protein